MLSFSIKSSSTSLHPVVTMCACEGVSVQVLLRRNRHTSRSFLSSSRPEPPRVCGPSCASAWRPGSGRSPGRWCTGTATLRCACAGAWSWPSSLWTADGTAYTQMASHLWKTFQQKVTLIVEWVEICFCFSPNELFVLKNDVRIRSLLTQ